MSSSLSNSQKVRSMLYFSFRLHSLLTSQDYPANPPKVTALTTNSGRCRFAPNIYANGKVCLCVRPIAFTYMTLTCRLQVYTRVCISSLGHPKILISPEHGKEGKERNGRQHNA